MTRRSRTEPRNGGEQYPEQIGRTPLLLTTLGLFAFAVGVYWPSCRYGFLYDETAILFRTVPPQTVTEFLDRLWSPHFPGLDYFRPVPHATYLAQYAFDRNGPGGFHAFNALLMGVTACVAFALLRLRCFRIRTMPAAFAAALFAVHPASSSSVTPIVGRETLLGACLTIGAVYAFLRGGRVWYVASLFLLALALLSKEQAVVVPLLFVLGDLLGLSEDAPRSHFGRWLRRYAPCVFVLAIYLAVRWSIFSGTEYRLQVLEVPVGPLLSVGYALQTAFTPFAELAYEPALEVWLSYPRLAIAGILLLILAWAVARRWSMLRASALFWLGWFLLTLAPSANVIEQQAPYSERYVLLATLAVVAVAASVVSTIERTSPARYLTATAGVALVAASAACTIHRGRCFENKLTFASQWVRTSPHFGEAQMALGVELHLLGRTAEAADCFRAGLECEPASRRLCRLWLGKMLLVQGHFAEAEEQFRRLIEDDPGTAYPYYLSGIALRGLGETDRAAARFQRAVEIDPQLAGAHFLLADTLALQGRTVLAQYELSLASSLPVIDLSFSRVTDAHLEPVSRFADLKFLLLEASPIGDAGLKHLEGMTTLSRLWIPGTAVTDRGLVHVRRLENLNSLVLTDTRVTDDGVGHLVSLTRLKHLDVRNTGITREGLGKLKRGLSDCLILH